MRVRHALRHTHTLPAELNTPRHTLLVGFSGGLDSTVLAYALREWAGETTGSFSLNTQQLLVHVHHGLQACADDWLSHTEQQSVAWNVPFQALRMDATSDQGESPEAKARHVRYQAFSHVAQQLITQGQTPILVTAHHQDDQAETVLNQLFRGAGGKGLSAMPVLNEHSTYANAAHWRPFLGLSKQDLLYYAQHHQLSWVDDPTNMGIAFDRNFIRHELMPLIALRWPQAASTMSRSAFLLAEQQQLLDDLLLSQLHTKAHGWVLDTQSMAWSSSALVKAQALIRLWLQRCGMSMPSRAQLEQIVNIAKSQRGEVVWQDAVSHTPNTVRAYRHHLFAYTSIQNDAVPWTYTQAAQATQAGEVWQLGTAFPRSVGGLPLPPVALNEQVLSPNHTQYDITFNPDNNERVYWHDKSQSESVKNAFQRLGVPPWLRCGCPILRVGGMIVAIVNLKEFGYDS